MNKLREVVKGTNYYTKRLNAPEGNMAPWKNAFKIIHKPTNAWVIVENIPNRNIEIVEGVTPNLARGRGIGTNLRALATLYAIFANKRIIHHGININSRSKLRKKRNTSAKNIPTSTYIIRERLGWKQNGTNSNSNFKPKRNNNTKVKNWLKSRGLLK